MKRIEIAPKEVYNELRAMQDRERTRLITEALEGQDLTPVQRKRLTIEVEFSTRFENGELTPVDADGDVLRDPHGWPVDATDYIRETAKSLLSTSQEAPQAKAPVSGEELFHAMRGAKSDAERQQIYKAFKGG